MCQILKFVLFFLVVILPNPIKAQSSQSDWLQKLNQAYSGEKLKSIKSLTIVDYRKSLWPGQNETPLIPDFWRINEELTIDFENKRKHLLSWRVDRTNKDLEAIVFDGENSRVYDLLHEKYFEDDWYSFDNIGRSSQRTSDTFIARSILLNPGKVKFVDVVQYRGVEHSRVSVPLGNKTDYLVYISCDSGLITRVSRNHPRAGELNYIFSNHSGNNGIAYARDMNFFVGEHPRAVSVYRAIELEPKLERKFRISTEFKSWGKPINVSKMTVKTLSDNSYLVGKGRSLALFVNAGDYFISSGGDSKLKENFRHLQKHLNSDKPLKQSILSHHHSEHLNMLAPALELGATIFTVKEHLPDIKKKLGEKFNIERFSLITEEHEMGGGIIKVIDVPTAHASHNLVVYGKKGKFIFAEDHYETSYEEGGPRVFKNMVLFAKKLESLNLPINTLIDGHSFRMFSYKEFKKAIDSYKEPVCVNDLRVCRNG